MREKWKAKSRTMNRRATIAALLLLQLPLFAGAGDFAALCAGRTALERVYYLHRLGEKPPFEQTLPPDRLEKLVRQDLRKEAVLKKNYGVEITPTLLAAEVRRIDSTTRAPEMLAEIKAALGDDPARFAEVFAKPILAERLLRENFDNDDALHAPQRQQAAQTREEILAAKKNGADGEKLLALLQHTHANAVTKTTWQLGARPKEKPGAETADEAAIKQRFGANAQLLSAPRAADGKGQESYFADLPAELQNVLRAQLHQPGDVSAVIETPTGFLLFLTEEKTAASLRAATLTIPKRSYEEWLAQQPEEKP